jgi:hypothetical protein
MIFSRMLRAFCEECSEDMGAFLLAFIFGCSGSSGSLMVSMTLWCFFRGWKSSLVLFFSVLLSWL